MQASLRPQGSLARRHYEHIWIELGVFVEITRYMYGAPPRARKHNMAQNTRHDAQQRSIRLQGWLEKYSVSAPRWRKNWRSRLLVLWDDRICWHKGSLAWATDAAAGGLNRLEPETKVLRTPPIGGGTVLCPMRALSWQRFVGLGHRCRSLCCGLRQNGSCALRPKKKSP